MNRVENWDIRLFEWGESMVGKPFKWGSTDCASLVRDSMEVIYGEDVFHQISKWKSLRKATKVLSQVGDMGVLFSSMGGYPIERNFAQNGDIISAPEKDDEGLPRLGVVVNGYVICSYREDGVLRIGISDLDEGTELWRLPRG